MNDKKVKLPYTIYKTEYLFPEYEDLVYVGKIYSSSEEQADKLCHYINILNNDQYIYLCYSEPSCEGFYASKDGDLRIKCFKWSEKQNKTLTKS